MSWDDFSELYLWELDFANPQQKSDVDLCKRVAAQYGGPVLELGAGDGRIGLALAADGYDVTLLDASQAMCRLAKTKIEPGMKAEVICADMREFSLNRNYGLILLCYSSFQLLLTLEDQLECLKNIRRHLAPGGIVGLDLNPAVCLGADQPDPRHLYTRFWKEKKRTVSMWSSWTTDPLFQTRTWRDIYHFIDGEGKEERLRNQIELKHCGMDEIRLLLIVSCMELIEVWGDAAGGPPESDSDNLFVLARVRD